MTSLATSTGSLPVNPDTGSPYLFHVRAGDKDIYADRNDELLAGIIGEEYLDETDPEDAFMVRLEKSIALAEVLQESIVGSAVQAGDLTAEDDEDVWTPLMDPRETAIPAGDSWSHKVPLVLVRSFFDPYSDPKPPTGNILWIDPTDDLTLLDSMSDAGFITVVEHDMIENGTE